MLPQCEHRYLADKKVRSERIVVSGRDDVRVCGQLCGVWSGGLGFLCATVVPKEQPCVYHPRSLPLNPKIQGEGRTESVADDFALDPSSYDEELDAAGLEALL